MIAYHLRLLGLLAALLTCTTGHAAAQQAAQLQQIRLNLSGSLGDFYLLYGVDNDPAHLAAAQRRGSQIDLLFGQLAAPSDNDGRAVLEQLRRQWPTYRALLLELANALQRQQIADGGAIAELLRQHRQLTHLGERLSGYYPTPASPVDRQSQALTIQLQTLNSDYLAHSVGANVLGGDNPPLDMQAQAFSQGLQQLQQAQAGGEAQRLLQKIERKWRYIEPSLRHYQQDNIPSLVNRYSSRIIEDLALLPSLVQAAQ
jgi:hypothetical protein